MKKYRLLFIGCILFNLLNAQQPSSRICASCIGGDGGGGEIGITCPVISTVLYVDASKSSSGDGKSWGTAKKTLQEALFIANQCDKVYSILIAEGVYKATTGSDRNNTFFIGNKFNLKGGYPSGGGASDPAAHATILDGDIGVTGVQTDNSYHVLVIAGFTGDITIEGLQIRNGYANGTGDLHLYDDVYLARSQAAGLYADDLDGTITLRNCAFSNNRATGAGGAITSISGSLNIFQNIFYNNSANIGAVMWNYNGSFTVKNSTIYHTGENGVLGNVTLSNSIIWGNNNLLAPTGITTQYCVVPAGRAGEGNITEDPQFVSVADGEGADHIWFTSDDGLRLKYCSPAINRGNNAIGYDGETDIAGNDRIYNINIDIGAYEYQLPAIPVTANLLATDNVSTETFVYGGTTALTNDCLMIASLLPNGDNPVQGDITATVFIEENVPEHNGKYYVARHYNILHSQIQNKPSARVTLYFTQDDFTNYNNAVGNKTDHLPANATDITNISKIRVNQFHGSSQDGTGLPSSYETDFTFIDPEDEDIEWHTGRGGAPGYWTVSFNITGFSGFFITAGANSALPVEWVDFTANAFQQKVQLNWQTASEFNNSHFIVQRSINGIDFENTARINTAGNNNNIQQYSWVDNITSILNSSILYYRLLQVDLDGKYSYSKTVQVRIKNNAVWISSIINPVKNNIQFTVQAEQQGKLSVKLIDIQGRIILQSTQTLKQGINNIHLPATQLAKGMYLLELVEDGKRVVQKLLKD